MTKNKGVDWIKAITSGNKEKAKEEKKQKKETEKTIVKLFGG